jgi:hypothetical protein
MIRDYYMVTFISTFISIPKHGYLKSDYLSRFIVILNILGKLG